MEPTTETFLSTVLNQEGLLSAFFGALGGMVRSAALKTTWKEGLRVAFIGAGCAFGVGALAPSLIRPYFPDLPSDMAGTFGLLGSTSFIVGLVAVTFIERKLDNIADKGSTEDGKDTTEG